MNWLYSGIFLWLAVSGGYTGWETPWALSVNSVLSIAVVCWGLWKRPALKPLTPWFLAFLAVQVVSAIANHNTNVFALWRTAVWIAAYQLPVERKTLRRAALIAALVYIPLCPWMPDGNNVVAFNIWTLYFLADYRRWWWVSITALAMVLTHSAGGVLALGTGMAVQFLGTQVLWVAPVGIAVMTLIKRLAILPMVFGGNSVTERIAMIRYALDGLLQSPFIGNSNTYEFISQHRPAVMYHNRFMLLDGDVIRWGAWHAHNLVADVAFQSGIIGLLIFAGIVWTVYRTPGRHTALIFAFLVHSLVDSPIYYFLPAAGILLALGTHEYRTNNRWWHYWHNIRRYRFGAGATAQTSFGVDTRATDTGTAGVAD